jgi:hypothetical protein
MFSTTARASRAGRSLLSLLAVLLAGVARAGCSGTAETYSGAVVKSCYWSSSSVGKGTRLSYSQCESKCDDHPDCWKWQFTQGRRGGGCTLHGNSAQDLVLRRRVRVGDGGQLHPLQREVLLRAFFVY